MDKNVNKIASCCCLKLNFLKPPKLGKIPFLMFKCELVDLAEIIF